MARDYLKINDLEKYLFEEVARTFRDSGRLDAFDFFCIVIWKANRAKSRIAALLLRKFSDLERAVGNLTASLARERDRKERMRLLISDWGFNLPMASAILTVLCGNDYTVYDYRVCDQVGGFQDTQNTTEFKKMWSEYENYIAAVDRVGQASDRRNKDRWLWGKSFSEQLEKNIASGFKNALREAAFCWIQGCAIGHRFTYSDVHEYLEATFPDECASRGKSGCREDVRRTVKEDAIKHKKIAKEIGRSHFERSAPSENTAPTIPVPLLPVP